MWNLGLVKEWFPKEAAIQLALTHGQELLSTELSGRPFRETGRHTQRLQAGELLTWKGTTIYNMKGRLGGG